MAATAPDAARRRVALVSQNRQDAAAIRELAGELGRRRWAEPYLLSLDRFFHQGAELAFEGTEVPVREALPERPLAAPFYHLGRFQRLGIVLRNRRRLAREAARYDALVAGCDGAVERILINAFKRRRRPTYLVINSLHVRHPVPPLKRALRGIFAAAGLSHLFFSEIGQGGCDRIFTLGDHSRGQLLAQGVPDRRIEVTGSPRFSPLVRPGADLHAEIGSRLGRRPLRLLYLAGAWEWHGWTELGRGERQQLARLDRCLARAPAEFELGVRHHPRATPGERAGLERLGLAITAPERPMAEEVDAADVVVSAVSTGVVEAVARGRLALSLDLFGVAGTMAPGARLDRLCTLRTDEELESALATIAAGGEALGRRIAQSVDALWHFISPDTPTAARRIVDRLEQDLGIGATRAGGL